MKEKIRKIKNKFMNTRNIHKSDIVLFIILALLVFLLTSYDDIQYTVTHTLNYMDAISKGHIFDLYKVNYLVRINGNLTNVCYDMPIYIIFALWNLPLWIIQNIFKIDVIHNFFCMIWVKTLLLVFLYGSMKVIEQICKEIQIDKRYIKWISLIFVSSPLVFSSLYYMSQYDIITIFFMLLGILSYVKKDYKKFIFWFMIAIPLKLFPIFVFVPLILLYEKRILKIGVNLLKGCSLLIVTKIIQQFMPYYQISIDNFGSSMIGNVLNYSNVKIGYGLASTFITIYALICLYCYLKELKNDEERYKLVIYIPFITYLILFVFILAHPYWLIYIVPFLTIILFQNPKYFKVNLLLDMILSGSAIIVQTLSFSWCFSFKQLKYMLLSVLFPHKDLSVLRYPTIISLIEGRNIEGLKYLFNGLFLFAVIALIYLNYPKKDSSTIKIERSVIWTRMLVFMPILLLLLMCYFIG